MAMDPNASSTSSVNLESDLPGKEPETRAVERKADLLSFAKLSSACVALVAAGAVWPWVNTSSALTWIAAGSVWNGFIWRPLVSNAAVIVGCLLAAPFLDLTESPSPYHLTINAAACCVFLLVLIWRQGKKDKE